MVVLIIMAEKKGVVNYNYLLIRIIINYDAYYKLYNNCFYIFIIIY